MAEPYYLIDSNSVIDYLSGRFPDNGMSFMNDVIDSVVNISVITKIEVLGFNGPEDDMLLLRDFMDASVVLYLTEEIVQECIAIRKEHVIKLPDAIISATALVYDMDLITRNTADFKKIQGLQTVNPHML